MMNTHTKNPCGWSGHIQKFLALSRSEWLIALHEHHQACMNCPADESQKSVWEHSFEILQKELKQLVQLIPELGNYTIIFEYELPQQQGMRPDVIILGASIFILEFRDSGEMSRADTDQVDTLARDLKQYHQESHQYDVLPILVPVQVKDLIRRDEDVLILSPDHIADFFNVQTELEDGPLIDANRWMSAG